MSRLARNKPQHHLVKTTPRWKRTNEQTVSYHQDVIDVKHVEDDVFIVSIDVRSDFFGYFEDHANEHGIQVSSVSMGKTTWDFTCQMQRLSAMNDISFAFGKQS